MNVLTPPLESKVKMNPLLAMKAQRGSRGRALPILSLGARWAWVVNATSWSPLFTGAAAEYDRMWPLSDSI